MQGYKKQLENVAWNDPIAANDRFKQYYGDQDLQQWTLPPDQNVPGFAPGMDDLAQIILNNKYKAKFNRNTLTKDGAQDWVEKKNKSIKDPSKYWRAGVADLNKDGIPEIVIKDGKGDIRYINGWHLGKSSHKMDEAYQNYIENNFGLPYDRLVKKATGQIPEKAMSHMYFMKQNLNPDPNNPDGALIPTDTLTKAGYVARAPSAANLFLTYVVKDCYNYVMDQLDEDENTKKMIKKICSVIQANAIVYKVYVSSEAIKYFNSQGVSEKDAKKKKSGQKVSPFSYYCLKRVEEIAGDDNTKRNIVAFIKERLLEPIVAEYKYEAAAPIYSKNANEIANGAWDGKHIRPPRSTAVPNIKAYMANAGDVPITAEKFLNTSPHFYTTKVNNQIPEQEPYQNNVNQPDTQSVASTVSRKSNNQNRKITPPTLAEFKQNPSAYQKNYPNYITIKNNTPYAHLAGTRGAALKLSADELYYAMLGNWSYEQLKAYRNTTHAQKQQVQQQINQWVQQQRQ